MFVCPVCGKTFFSKDDLIEHHKEFHMSCYRREL